MVFVVGDETVVAELVLSVDSAEYSSSILDNIEVDTSVY